MRRQLIKEGQNYLYAYKKRPTSLNWEMETKLHWNIIFHHKIGKNSKADHDILLARIQEKRFFHPSLSWWPCELPPAPGEGCDPISPTPSAFAPASKPTPRNVLWTSSLNSSKTPLCIKLPTQELFVMQNTINYLNLPAFATADKKGGGEGGGKSLWTGTKWLVDFF